VPATVSPRATDTPSTSRGAPVVLIRNSNVPATVTPGIVTATVPTRRPARPPATDGVPAVGTIVNSPWPSRTVTKSAEVVPSRSETLAKRTLVVAVAAVGITSPAARTMARSTATSAVSRWPWIDRTTPVASTVT